MDEINLSILFDKYNEAFDIIKEKFDLIYKEFSHLGEKNPIEFIKYRMKKPESILMKLVRKSVPFTTENVEDSVNDIIGVRIVCSFLNDVETMKNVIEGMISSGKLTKIKEKDYVNNPKENGYSSYHIIVSKPVRIDGKDINIKFEIQIRTIAMDMAASLEHKLNYKYKKDKIDSSCVSDLRETYEFCNRLDKDMNSSVLRINNSIDDRVFDIPKFMNGYDYDYKMVKFKYEEALKIIQKELVQIKDDYDNEGLVNPIEHIKVRLKDNESVVRKLMLNGRYVSLDNVTKYVNDMAGARVVCSFKTDLYELVDLLKERLIEKGCEIFKEKDYVSSPKETGYRGYHLIVGVPVDLSNGLNLVKVEIQIRTIAMEMWASLEQKICYHKNTNEETRNELKRLASVISGIDDKVDGIVIDSKQNNDVKKLVRKKINN